MSTNAKSKKPATIGDVAIELNALSCTLQNLEEVLALFCEHHGRAGDSGIPFLVRDNLEHAWNRLNGYAAQLEAIDHEMRAAVPA
ncbi:MAG: hypothetical protein M0015_10830 [Betaproteobacteria bacterium]|nr:hypothetical protein [Betaproteobacteria bacterium]